MRYVLLVFQGTTPLPGTPAWNALSPDEQQRVYRDYAAFNADARVTAGLPLGLAAHARTVTVAGGTFHVTDGPHAGAAWAVGGYSIVETDTIDDALALAATIPAARLGGAVEVRPVERYW